MHFTTSDSSCVCVSLPASPPPVFLVLSVVRNGEVVLADGKLSVEDSGRLLSECVELLCAVADFAHGRCTKLLSFRARVSACWVEWWWGRGE